MGYSLYNKEPVIRTYTGRWMNVFDPTPNMICIEDIAHALSNQCRFGGHLKSFYSVGQHSIHCSRLADRPHQIAALLHDAAEAYLVDIPTPIKKRLPGYAGIEDTLMHLIADVFCFQYPLHPQVKEVDALMLEYEWNSLMLNRGTFPKPFPMGEVEGRFLMEYEICNLRGKKLKRGLRLAS